MTRVAKASLATVVARFRHCRNAQYLLVKNESGLVRKALGYAVRQEHALRRFLEDGRLSMDNTAAEREIKQLVVLRLR
jgi:hypothetical protein